MIDAEENVKRENLQESKSAFNSLEDRLKENELNSNNINEDSLDLITFLTRKCGEKYDGEWTINSFNMNYSFLSNDI